MEAEAPLLRRNGGDENRGLATWAQTFGNVVVSIIGTGVLGLPYAFRVAGWLAGSLGVALSGLSICYCMLLLVQCRNRIKQDGTDKTTNIQSYGDLGAKAFGNTGRWITEILVLISQAGGAIAYLIFIGQNLSSLFINHYSVSPSVFIFLLLLPLEIVLSFIRSLSTLAPFSAFADACNILAMAMVIKQDFQLITSSNETRHAFNGALGLPFAAGMAVFCFEGFSMTLALEASMAERKNFRSVLSLAFFGITFGYICFGIFGYLAYGDDTLDIITLNLSDNWLTTAVKLGLCIALAFTFPMMMHPFHDIVDSKLKSSTWFHKMCNNAPRAETCGLNVGRALMVALMAVLASYIPAFGNFISLVGSTVCAMLAFVLPATFHLTLVGSQMKSWERLLDYFLLIAGVIFACYGTYNAVSGKAE